MSVLDEFAHPGSVVWLNAALEHLSYSRVTPPDWATTTVVELMDVVLEQREQHLQTNQTLAVLADAMEEAGCRDEVILKLFRSPLPVSPTQAHGKRRSIIFQWYHTTLGYRRCRRCFGRAMVKDSSGRTDQLIEQCPRCNTNPYYSFLHRGWEKR